MRVRDILNAKSREAMAIEPEALVEHLACRLRLADVGAMLVCGPGGRLLGVAAERHITQALADYGPRALAMPVSRIMDDHPPTCGPDDRISYVAKIMVGRRTRYVPVVQDGALLGVVSVGDVVKHRLEELELEANVLRDRAPMGGLGDDSMLDSPLYR